MDVHPATRRKWLAGIVIAAIGSGSAVPKGADASADRLLPWRWRARLLLVFAPSDSEPALRLQRALLSPDAAGAAERSLVVIEVVGDRCSDPRLDGAALRSALRVSERRFAAILIGKDGGEKLRASRPVPMQTVFAVIDAMPMGRAEASGRAEP